MDWKDWLQIFGALTLIVLLMTGVMYFTSESPLASCRLRLVEAMALTLGSIPMVVVHDADRACRELEAMK